MERKTTPFLNPLWLTWGGGGPPGRGPFSDIGFAPFSGGPPTPEGPNPREGRFFALGEPPSIDRKSREARERGRGPRPPEGPCRLSDDPDPPDQRGPGPPEGVFLFRPPRLGLSPKGIFKRTPGTPQQRIPHRGPVPLFLGGPDANPGPPAPKMFSLSRGSKPRFFRGHGSRFAYPHKFFHNRRVRRWKKGTKLEFDRFFNHPQPSRAFPRFWRGPPRLHPGRPKTPKVYPPPVMPRFFPPRAPGARDSHRDARYRSPISKAKFMARRVSGWGCPGIPLPGLATRGRNQPGKAGPKDPIPQAGGPPRGRAQGPTEKIAKHGQGPEKPEPPGVF